MQITVTVNGDLLDEDDETFFVNLSGASGGTIADGVGVGTITDDDPLPGVSIADLTVSEPPSGTSTAQFTVTLSAASGRTVSVPYSTANGTATAGSDYDAATGTVVFAPGETSRTIGVTIRAD